MFAFAIIVFGTNCKNNKTIDNANNSVNSTEKVKISSENLKEDYDAWFELKGKFMENFPLQITEVQYGEYSWETEKLVIALVENLKDRERGGFFIAKNKHLSVNALNEVIVTLENVATQIKNDTRQYSCNRMYITSHEIQVTFHYSSSKKNWDSVKIYYSEKNPMEIKPEYLMNYIEGLKVCKQNIVDYTAGKWSNQ